MTNRQAILERIQKLSERTTDRGFTENEAMVAAGMLAKMLAEHGLSMSDIQIRERDDCEQGEIATGRKRDHEIRYCLLAIANFTDCRSWRSRRHDGSHYVFFGFPEDVMAAKSLYHTIFNAMQAESVRFARENPGRGKAGGHSFRLGMASRVAKRLNEMKREQDTETKAETGRELVVVKAQVVSKAFDSLGIRLGSGSRGSGARDGAAYQAGQAAGSRVSFSKSLPA